MYIFLVGVEGMLRLLPNSALQGRVEGPMLGGVLGLSVTRSMRLLPVLDPPLANPRKASQREGAPQNRIMSVSPSNYQYHFEVDLRHVIL